MYPKGKVKIYEINLIRTFDRHDIYSERDERFFPKILEKQKGFFDWTWGEGFFQTVLSPQGTRDIYIPVHEQLSSKTDILKFQKYCSKKKNFVAKKLNLVSSGNGFHNCI